MLTIHRGYQPKSDSDRLYLSRRKKGRGFTRYQNCFEGKQLRVVYKNYHGAIVETHGEGQRHKDWKLPYERKI